MADSQDAERLRGFDDRMTDLQMNRHLKFLQLKGG